MTPQFTHDCDRCHYLGRYTCEMYGECDLYHCEPGRTVIARYGNDGPEYTSGFAFVGMVPGITEAYQRAKGCGLVVPEIREHDLRENYQALLRWRAGRSEPIAHSLQ